MIVRNVPGFLTVSVTIQVILFALRPTSTQLAVAAKFENSLCDLLRQRAECRTPEDEEDTFELAVMEKCLQSVVNRVSRMATVFVCWNDVREVCTVAVHHPCVALHAYGGSLAAGHELLRGLQRQFVPHVPLAKRADTLRTFASEHSGTIAG